MKFVKKKFPVISFSLLLTFLIGMIYLRVFYRREPIELSLEFSIVRIIIGVFIIMTCFLYLYQQIIKHKTKQDF